LFSPLLGFTRSSAFRRFTSLPASSYDGFIRFTDEIVSVEGVDGVFVGPNDLSASLGVFRDFENPVYRGALRRVVDAAGKAGRIAGIMTSGVEDALDKISMGFNFIALSSDIQHLLRSYVDELRKLGLSV
jgi:2-keto-3-deoxy-L-rhamnonate aldolase RhmA